MAAPGPLYLLMPLAQPGWGVLLYGVGLGALVGGTLGSQLGLRTALWICVLGTWSAALFVVFSPLRTMRDLPAT
ncbi:hypothetical protein ACIBF5_10785 [Micromonospora sp. NPDC050417]|uniref:hypothetical protein n=1 Tax=Micromonospora sp. NPDC050417 TaxID=3364280 RepID=UPI0037B4A1D8